MTLPSSNGQHSTDTSQGRYRRPHGVGGGSRRIDSYQRHARAAQVSQPSWFAEGCEQVFVELDPHGVTRVDVWSIDPTSLPGGNLGESGGPVKLERESPFVLGVAVVGEVPAWSVGEAGVADPPSASASLRHRVNRIRPSADAGCPACSHGSRGRREAPASCR